MCRGRSSIRHRRGLCTFAAQAIARIRNQSNILQKHDLGEDTGQIVALKVLHRFSSNDSNYVERFRREASLASSIDHPNVVKIFEVGQDGDQHFMALEFLPESLARVIEGGGQMRLDRATEFGVQIADGLAEAHALGIVHRDIKPQNILIGTDGVAKVTDFGIARADVMNSVTATGDVVGTPHYMSPEQSRGEETDARSDVYSLGCMLYQMVTGELPFNGNTPLAVIRQQIEDEPTPMGELRADLTPGLESVVHRAMAKDRDGRFQSISDLSTAPRDSLPEIEVVTREGPRAEPAVALPITRAQPSERPSHTWMETWVGAWQRARRSRLAQTAAVLSLLLALAVGPVRLGLWDEVSGFVGISRPETPQSAPQPQASVPPGAPAEVLATAVSPPATVPPIQSAAPLGRGVLVPPPADQLAPSANVEVVLAAAEPARLVSPQGQITVDIGAGAVRDDVTLTYQPVKPDQIPPLPLGFTLSEGAFDLSVTGAPAEEQDKFRFDTPIVVTISLSVRDVVLAGGASRNIVIQHFHADRWELLPTTVDFVDMVARAEVDGLSIFALTIREPEPEPAAALESTPATALPTAAAAANIATAAGSTAAAAPTLTPTSTLTPTPPTRRPTSTPTRTLKPTVSAALQPPVTPTPTPTPTITPAPTILPTITPTPTPAAPLISAL